MADASMLIAQRCATSMVLNENSPSPTADGGHHLEVVPLKAWE